MECFRPLSRDADHVCNDCRRKMCTCHSECVCHVDLCYFCGCSFWRSHAQDSVCNVCKCDTPIYVQNICAECVSTNVLDPDTTILYSVSEWNEEGTPFLSFESKCRYCAASCSNGTAGDVDACGCENCRRVRLTVEKGRRVAYAAACLASRRNGHVRFSLLKCLARLL